MRTNDRYDLILGQAVGEIAGATAGQETVATSRRAVRYDLAPELADTLWRLCVEHGVDFNTFRETVIGTLSDQDPTEANDGRLGAGVTAWHPLIVLALELMPADPPV